jgi:hypothetical protein
LHLQGICEKFGCHARGKKTLVSSPESETARSGRERAISSEKSFRE